MGVRLTYHLEGSLKASRGRSKDAYFHVLCKDSGHGVRFAFTFFAFCPQGCSFYQCNHLVFPVQNKYSLSTYHF